MQSRLSLTCLAALLCFGATAQTPVADLAKPPASARHYVIVSTGGKHGDSYVWAEADGTRRARESMNMRGMVSELDYSGKAGADGMPDNVVVRGTTPAGDAGETYSIANGMASWVSPVDKGSTKDFAKAFYVAQGAPFDANAWFLERLLAQPGQTMNLLPAGRAHATKLKTLQVKGKGGESETIVLWSITGLGNSPIPIWADSKGKFFGFTQGVGWLPEAFAGEQQRMEDAQSAALAVQTESISKAFLKAPIGTVAFVNVRMFDADNLTFLSGQTIVVDKGKIAAVGPVDAIKVPAKAKVIDGKGMTLVPGMWDCHMHVGDDYTGLQELSLGITSIRDPGNSDKLTMDRRARVAAGKLLMPKVHASSLIDGEGPYSAQVANIARSQDDAIKLVQQARKNGFTGVKFYGTFNPAWLPAAIQEAHKLGLHVHGHIPAGIRPMDAINAGYDEVTHINWVIMEALPESVIKVSNGMMRFEGPGRYAKDVDLDAAPMQNIISTMAKKKIYSDPTMAIFETSYVAENGDLSPAYAPFVGTLPPTTERGFRAGGFAVPKDLTRADYRASWAKI